MAGVGGVAYGLVFCICRYVCRKARGRGRLHPISLVRFGRQSLSWGLLKEWDGVSVLSVVWYFYTSDAVRCLFYRCALFVGFAVFHVSYLLE